MLLICIFFELLIVGSSGTVWVEMSRNSGLSHWIDFTRVMSVLDFHASIIANVYIITPRLLPGIVVLYLHEHVECFREFVDTEYAISVLIELPWQREVRTAGDHTQCVRGYSPSRL